MNVVQVVIFQRNAAIYLNQKFYDLIDDNRDIEQILEAVKGVGHFEFQIYQNDNVSEIYEKVGSLPLLVDEAIEYSEGNDPELIEPKIPA